jgi:serine/threonine-protein kinase
MSEGQIIAEKYRLIERISSGGMGAVWRAEHLELGMPAAVKLIDPALADTEEGLLRFRREAQAAASLRSTNIVQIFDYGVSQGVPYIAMELLRGQSLARRLLERGKLPPAETATILTQVGKAVGWAHNRGVVHRDLKPDNVFLAEDAGETVVKLLDFGIAKQFEVKFDATPTTMTGAMIGTPFYMSPEQAGGKKSVDFRLDIWAFAVIAFECITGKRPFNSDTLGGLVLAICSEPLPKPSSVGEVPAGFDEWFARAAHRDLNQRYSSIREAADDLRRVCSLPPEGPPLTLPSLEQSASAATPAKAVDTVLSSSNPAESADLGLSHGPTTLNQGTHHGLGQRLKQQRVQIALLLIALAAGVAAAMRVARPAEAPPAALTYIAASVQTPPISTVPTVVDDENARQVVPVTTTTLPPPSASVRAAIPVSVGQGNSRISAKTEASAKPSGHAHTLPDRELKRAGSVPSAATTAKGAKSGTDLDAVVGF